MDGQVAIQNLFADHIREGNHKESDYFGLIKKLVAQRNNFPELSPERSVYQEAVDAVYDLVMQEILTNDDEPVTPVKFGTSGWRGILGKDVFVKSVGLVTEAIVAMYLQLAAELSEKDDMIKALGVQTLAEAQKRGCVVGFDNRFGGAILAEEVVRVVTANSITVHYAGEATTGTLSAALVQLGAAFSINLTPSHNPLEYAGFKYNAADGGPAASILTDKIGENARAIFARKRPGGINVFSSPVKSEIHKVDALQLWFECVRAGKELHGLDYDQIMGEFASSNDIVVAVDCVHGASRLHMLDFFKNPAGGRLFVRRDSADPTFGGIAPEPSSANMQPVMKFLASRSEPLKLGAIIDPDGDRIRFTDGTYEISMNQFGALAFYYLHEVKKKKGLLAKTVATSNFANCLANALHEEIFETKVGFKEFKPVIDQALVCFEESDGITVKGHTSEKDAYIGLLLALDLVLTLKKNLGTYLHEIEETYGRFFPASAGVAVSKQGEALQEILAGLEQYTVGKSVAVGNRVKKITEVIAIDGRKMIMDDGSWIMIRPSGTEPKVRFYVEARTDEEKEGLIDTAKSMLQGIGLL